MESNTPSAYFPSSDAARLQAILGFHPEIGIYTDKYTIDEPVIPLINLKEGAFEVDAATRTVRLLTSEVVLTEDEWDQAMSGEDEYELDEPSTSSVRDGVATYLSVAGLPQFTVLMGQRRVPPRWAVELWTRSMTTRRDN